MNKTWLTAVCAAGMLLGTAAVKAQEPEMAPPPPHREMKARPAEMGPRHPGRMEDRLADELNLTAEQKAALKKAREENREKMKPLMEQMKELRRQMEELRKNDMDSLETVLTEEQKKAYEEIKAKRHERIRNRADKLKSDRGMRPLPRGEKGADMLPPPPPAK